MATFLQEAASRSTGVGLAEGTGESQFPVGAHLSTGYLALYLNFCPPTAAWYINPPLATVNTAIPLW